MEKNVELKEFEWGMVLDHVGLYEAKEIERLGYVHDLEVNLYFREESFLYTVEVIWHECASEEQKRFLLQAIKNLIKNGG